MAERLTTIHLLLCWPTLFVQLCRRRDSQAQAMQSSGRASKRRGRKLNAVSCSVCQPVERLVTRDETYVHREGTN